jgi:hypothetical protein
LVGKGTGSRLRPVVQGRVKKMFKKTMLLALAVMATMAFAVPAVASASGGAIWMPDTEETLGEGEEVSFSGTFGFTNTASTSGFASCEISGTLTQGAGVSEVTASLTMVPGCSGVGQFGGCEVKEASGSGGGTVTGHDIDLLNVVITVTMNATCGSAIGLPGALEHSTFDFPEMTLQPAAESETSLDDLTLSGIGTWTTKVGNLEVVASGTIGADEEGTWAIETCEC